MYLLVIIVCAFSCVVGYFIGLTVEDLLREMFPSIQAEAYEDHENAETIVFITLVDKPAYSVKKVIINDCEYLTLFQEAREL